MNEQNKQGHAIGSSNPTEIIEQSHPEKSDGVEFYFANDDERLMGIETAVYDNGNTVKRIKLSNGKVAIARELTGAEMKRMEAVSGGKKEEAWPSLMHLSVKVDGHSLPPEDFDLMKAKDWNKVKIAVSDLNF